MLGSRAADMKPNEKLVFEILENGRAFLIDVLRKSAIIRLKVYVALSLRTAVPVKAVLNLNMSSSEQSDTPASIDRDIKVMSPPQGAAGAQPVPESFYKLTSAEIKQLYQSQVGKRQALENAPLKTKQMRNAEEKERMKKYPKTTIRVRFADGLILQISFQSSEKVSTLYDVIRSTLKIQEREFLLVLPPRTQLLVMNQTLFKAGLAPASNVTFVGAKTGGDKEKHELSDEYLSKVQQMPRPTDHTDSAPVSSGSNQASQSQNASGSIKENVSKTVPKWLQKGLFKK